MSSSKEMISQGNESEGRKSLYSEIVKMTKSESRLHGLDK